MDYQKVYSKVALLHCLNREGNGKNALMVFKFIMIPFNKPGKLIPAREQRTKFISIFNPFFDQNKRTLQDSTIPTHPDGFIFDAHLPYCTLCLLIINY